MFSKACEYAIKAMIFIELKSSASRKISLNEIAEAIDSPVAFTAKILQKLRKSGLIISTIGARGGFQIEENKSITIKEIVIAIDGDGFFNKCILGLNVCSSANPCPAHATYSRIREILLTDLLNLSINQFSKLLKKKYISLK
ncbi:MAG: Rrf2 family transcriptional regulator [Saprospiraceae bacterium]|nr:Rrf2 family transcriptional regulator [Bacteroidota bacterium]